ncbi:MAG: GAF domain-containing protein [Myxococcales bacterium]|nr:GAF domain-containing protein [Myxococcales bacterium]
MSVALHTLEPCFHGIFPGVVATADRDGTPNVSYVSQVHLVDDRHVALSCQFFNKTRQNLDVNPRATIEVYDPVTFQAYRLRVTFLRSETSGPLFETMALRIQAIASVTGMSGVFKLRSADVCEVLVIEKREGYIAEPPVDERRNFVDGPMTEIRGLQLVSDRISRSCGLESMLGGSLAALDEVFGFSHSMILVPDETGTRLVTLASHGYGDAAIGAEVRFGEGLIGTVAQGKRLVRIASLDTELRYGRAVRAEYASAGDRLAAEIPLPGLPDAQSQLAIPLLMQDRLIGVLALECRDTGTFAQWHESFLQILANQIAAGIERMTDADDDDDEPPARPSASQISVNRRISLTYFRNDDCVFVDGEYLIRNVPAKILWKLLRAHETSGRNEFSNRELRLDPSLGLPAYKDNLESRLILLRKRLEQKCPDLRLVPTKRGRFALEVGAKVELVERETA